MVKNSNSVVNGFLFNLSFSSQKYDLCEECENRKGVLEDEPIASWLEFLCGVHMVSLWCIAMEIKSGCCKLSHLLWPWIF